MTLQEQIDELETKVQEATEAYTKACVENSLNVKFYEDELVRLTTELNILKMRRPV